MVESLALKGDVPSSPGHVKLASAFVPTTRATLPAVDPRLIDPVASAVGTAIPLVVPPDSCTRKYLPGAIMPVVRFVLFVPKFDPTPAYWTEWGVTDRKSTRLNSSHRCIS